MHEIAQNGDQRVVLHAVRISAQCTAAVNKAVEGHISKDDET